MSEDVEKPVQIWNELFVALVTGAITSGIIAIVSRVRSARRDRAIQAAFPIAGDYVTVYEDTHDGQTSRVKEFIRLDQKGTHVSGKSVGVDDDRSFLFKAEIIETRFLTGAYYDENPARGGFGTYFLEPTMPGEFEGVWAGYGSDQRTVVSGKYSWRRVADGIDVRQLKMDDAPSLAKAVAILGEGLGARYVSQEDLESKLWSPDGASAVFGAFAEGSLVGVATTAEVDPGLTKNISERCSEVGGIPPAFDFHETGLIESSAVSTQWRRKGFGSRLLDVRLRHLRSEGYTAALAISWVSGQMESSRSLFASAGFENRCEIPDYWHESSIREGFSCPRCGTPCRCSAIVFFRAL